MQPSAGTGGGSGSSGDHQAWERGLLALEQPGPPRKPTRRERRIARWTRPAPRRDVRWAIGRLGQILIVVGLLMFGFVGYQLWGTGIEYARAQSQATDAVEQLMDEARQRAGLDVTDGSASGSAGTIELDSEVLDPLDPLAAESTLPATSTATGVTADDRTRLVEFEWNEVIEDEQWFAYLSIPRLDRTDKIIEGVGREALKKGPGHFPTTPLPGQLGNSALAGHRTSFGAVFLEIDQLQPGDEIVVETPYGGPNNGPGRFVYVVTHSEIVRPDDVRVIATVDPEIATLTLVTCHPVYKTSERLIVHAELDLDQSDEPGPAVIPADLPPLDVLPGDDALTTSSPTGTTPADALGGFDDTADEGEPDELIGGGWFEDTEAWPQVALWGGLTVLVVLLAYGLAKLTRFGLVGLAFGIVPFLVTLYFTYQNVNRLLPAAF